jgi:hypothetical protein
MTISARYLTISILVAMTIQNPTTILFGDHPGKQWRTSRQKIPSRQHLENKAQQLN